MVSKLRKSIEGLVQVGLSIGLQHVTEVMFSNNTLKAVVFLKKNYFQIVSLDDETYSEFDEKLPQCQ